MKGLYENDSLLLKIKDLKNKIDRIGKM